MTDRKPPGEPYDLAGKRLVFTNWLYVRTYLDWGYEKEGIGAVGKSESLGPWEADLKVSDLPSGIRLVAQPAERLGPLLKPERMWEQRGIAITTVIEEGGVYRGWGNGRSEVNQKYNCYFESANGLDWTRPDLGLVDCEGSTKNNILDVPGVDETFKLSVFEDPAGSEGERYKAVSKDRIRRDALDAYLKRWPDDWEPGGIREYGGIVIKGAVSSDGFSWTVIEEPLVVECSDTQVTAYYDQALGKYVMYTRAYAVGPRSPRASGDDPSRHGCKRRAIGRSESVNFRHFPVSEVILEPGPDMPPSDVLYTNCRTTVPSAPDHHLMFPAIYHLSDDTTSVVMASSRDGKSWNFIPGPPVLKTMAFGEWDGGCIFAHPNLIELPNGDFVLPYTGFNFPHKYPRGQWRHLPGYAIWPKGRLVALEAPERGEFTTVGLMTPGRKLRINALTQRAGSILVEVATLDGKPIPGHTFAESIPVIGDQHWTPIAWKEHDEFGFEEGRAIILRFRMDKAKIFGLEFV